MSLTPKQSRFVSEYLIDLNATQAAIRAGYSERTAHAIGNENLSKPEIVEEIQKASAERSKRTEITQDMVLAKWWELANSNPNDLVQYRRTCCRHCHGQRFQYQWVDEEEWLRACASIAENSDGGKDIRLPSNDGGYGFKSRLDPHPDCPRCEGEGIGQVFVSDTRKLSGGALALYDGVKQTKEGLEIKLQDRAKALDNVARHLMMFVEKRLIGGDPANPLKVDATVSAASATLSAIKARLNGKA